MRTFKFSLIAIMICLALAAEAQIKLGVKAIPGINATRFSTNIDGAVLDGKSAVKFNAGVLLDFEFSENYYFSTGLHWMAKSINLESTIQTVDYNEDHDLQYVQVPLSLKLYTNEVAIDKRVYFQIGAVNEIKIQDDLETNQSAVYNKFAGYDVGLLLAAGMEMNLGTNTAAFAGLYFQRNFLNNTNDLTQLFNSYIIEARNTFVGIEIGVKF